MSNGINIGDRLNRMAGVDPVDEKQGKGPDKMDKEAFLKMFMQQLKYQDPMNPMKSEQFAQQMATFSLLEQQVNTNSNLEKLITASGDKQLNALSFIGKEIVSDQTTIDHVAEKPSEIKFTLPGEATELMVKVINDKGEEVAQVNPGAKLAGETAVRWDGLDANGQVAPAGKYSYEILAKGVDGKALTASSKLEGRVTGFSNRGGRIYLNIGTNSIELKDVKGIREPQPVVNSGTNLPAVSGLTTLNNSGNVQQVNKNKLDEKQKDEAVKESVSANSVPGTEIVSKDTEKKIEKNLPSVSVGDDLAKSFGSLEQVKPGEEDSLRDELLPFGFR